MYCNLSVFGKECIAYLHLFYELIHSFYVKAAYSTLLYLNKGTKQTQIFYYCYREVLIVNPSTTL